MSDGAERNPLDDLGDSSSGAPGVPPRDDSGEKGPSSRKTEVILDGGRLLAESAKQPTAVKDCGQGRDSSEAGDEYRSYKTRFWVLALFSLISLMQLTVWGTWGPIVESALVAYPAWGPNTAASFSNWPPLIGLLFMLPLSSLLQRIGLRKGVLVSAGLLAAASIVRCFPVDDLTFTVLCHVGSIMLGFSCCILLPQVGTVASVWFSPGEGTTAVAVALLMNQLGGVTMYFSPLVVRAPGEDVLPEDIRKDIAILMYIHFGLSLLLFVCVLLYFPDGPPSPPSPSSQEEREDFRKSLKDFLRNHHLILIVVAYGVSFGVVGNWLGFMTYSLLEIGIHQEESMGVAISASLSASVAAFFAARMTDRIYGHLKDTVISLLAASFAFFLWFFFLSTGVVEATLTQVYITVIAGVSLQFSSVPLLLQLCFELSYPISEGVVGALATSFFSFVSLAFLLLFLIPDVGYVWVSYALVSSVSLSIVPVFFAKEELKRTQVDRQGGMRKNPRTDKQKNEAVECVRCILFIFDSEL
ncbi:solute carrier family 49 member 4 homolog isoform X1 [Penaeus chinensis]|uniref:solute carrier family 49 member 4 homolog isoform X1 n=1 Tax=Penaeus chinensis TaxID=139456 RepID=UPI001FB7FE46|nr:solute carrier family 49 member 4 homolog isoform X1 [Penaeus chinensis]